MTPLQSQGRSRRSVLVSIGLGVALAALGLVFHTPLTAWFSGKTVEGSAINVGDKGLSAGGDHSDAGAGATTIDHYTCSMHPSVKQQGPGKCPICGMELIPVTKEQQRQGVVIIDEARRQLIGVRTSRVVEGPMRETFRAVGRVAYDESTLADVNLKVRGWITKLFVSQTGQRVVKGQPLFTMYSPELYNAQQDFLLSIHASPSSPVDPDAGKTRSDSFARAARLRLRLLGLDDAQMDAIAKSGAPVEDISVPSPASGFIIEKDVVEGASVDPGMRLFRIASLNKVWIEADVYDADLARARVGQSARVTLDYLPGRTYDAKVSYVYPYLDAKARTGRVRVAIANKDLELRPGMYASVELGSDVGRRLQVPAAAVVYTGPRRLVFIDLGEGRFKPQEIQVGTESDGMFAVLSGLQAGDMVATSGVFLIAAEARIRTAATYWQNGGAEVEDGGSAVTVDSSAPAPSSTAMPKTRGTHEMPTPQATRDAHPETPRAPPPPTTSGGAPTPAPVPAVSTIYTCPMHPEVRTNAPGQCPKCGMTLVPVGATP